MIDQDSPERLLPFFGIPQRFVHARKEDIAPEIWNAASVFLEGKGLYLHGPVGVGKTHLIAALLREKIIVSPAQKLLFTTVHNMLIEIRASFGNDERSGTEQELFRKYSGVPCLALDDLGTEKTTDWVMQTLEAIIDRRYGDLRQTLITSNLSLEKLSRKGGDRIASRIAGMCRVVELKGTDRRSAE